jgi:nucleoid-associated protein YgaU
MPVQAMAIPASTAPSIGPLKSMSWIWTVKKHDCLWNIAKTVYADPFKWVDIYKMNVDKIKDPHWIYPKQKFRNR